MRVEPELNRWDREVEELAKKGFAYQTISSHTGLSVGQVSYRCRQFGVSPVHYRQGRGSEARDAFAEMRQLLARIKFMRKCFK